MDVDEQPNVQASSSEEIQSDQDQAEESLRSKREEAEIAKKSKSLAELLLLMDDHGPIFPDAVTDHYLEQAGFQCHDQRIKRLIGLATQKFIADIATDALSYCKLRQQVRAADKNRTFLKSDKKTVLVMEDLEAALGEHGVNVNKPDFFT